MAIIRLGSTLDAASGGIGNVTFRATKRGPVLCNRPLKRQSSSAAALQSRRDFQAARAVWSILTDEERQQWNSAALDSVKINRLGVARPYTGFELCTQHNLIGFELAGPPYRVPPVGPVTPMPLALVVVDWTPPALEILWDLTGYPAVFLFHIYGARTFSTAIPSPHLPLSRLYTSYRSNTTTGIDIGPYFDDRLGAPESGEYIILRVRAIWPNGWTSPLSGALRAAAP